VEISWSCLIHTILQIFGLKKNDDICRFKSRYLSSAQTPQLWNRVLNSSLLIVSFYLFFLLKKLVLINMQQYRYFVDGQLSDSRRGRRMNSPLPEVCEGPNYWEGGENQFVYSTNKCFCKYWGGGPPLLKIFFQTNIALHTYDLYTLHILQLVSQCTSICIRPQWF
jgi:hypothetical protein